MRIVILLVSLLVFYCSGTQKAIVFKEPVVFERPVLFAKGATFEEGVSWGAQGNKEQLSLLTMNVRMWNYREAYQRLSLVFSLLERSSADVIALQEASYWFVYSLLRQPWVQQNYHVTRWGGQPFAPGGLVTLSRYPIKETKVRRLERAPYQRWRYALLAVIDYPGQPIAVGNVHLESILGAAAVRKQQIQETRSLLDPYRHSVLLGDFNFGDGALEENHLYQDFTDLWLRLRPGQPGYTWDMEKSWMARIYAFRGESSRRLDRILVRSDTFRPVAVSLVGESPLYFHRGSLFASDHFGVRGTISVSRGLAGLGLSLLE
ncbi:MAG: endonuclease/exonuclease/phosphatase family protein [Spirochaetales bacterium]|nr:endonuclease/exonuclease/phosphatase family protein [Spirochaetales bacterium]